MGWWRLERILFMRRTRCSEVGEEEGEEDVIRVEVYA